VSEYQYIAFRAINRPLTDRELGFARKQSTRAEITRWSFENVYHFGDFHGDADGLLTHGYDVYLHYANFGTRTVGFRLPAGPPIPEPLWLEYTSLRGLTWKKDLKGEGGILKLNPYHEAGGIDEIQCPEAYIEDVITIRNRLITGDLRVLYLLWLCAALDDDFRPDKLIEPPVPTGLGEYCGSCDGFVEFFGLDPLIVLAASEVAPEAPSSYDPKLQFWQWVNGLDEKEIKQRLQKLIFDDTAETKAQIYADIRGADDSPEWATVSPKRTFLQLLDRTQALRDEYQKKQERKRKAIARQKAEEKKRERAKRIKQMSEDPDYWVSTAERLVELRGTANYEAAAEILADLRDAIGGAEGERIAKAHAAHFTGKYPTLNRLKSSLRKQGLYGS